MVEWFNRLLVPPVQRRQAAWLNDLAERIAVLEQQGRLRVEDLQHNDEFVSTVMQASYTAIRNHQKEKIDALRNAVLNTALGLLLGDLKREMFLGFVDIFSVTHIRILEVLSRYDTDGRTHRIETSVRHITDLVVQLLPELKDERALAGVAVEELCRRGLLFWVADGIVAHIRQDETQVSQLGREFLRFISEPQKDD